MIKQEQIQANRLASASAMAKALSEARNRIKLGDWVTVREYSGSTSNEKRTVSGQVIYKNQHYFTLQGRHYREAFSFIDLAIGKIKLL